MKVEIGIFQSIASLVCDRSTDRTFSMYNGELLPLCARCTGIYAGFAIGVLSQVLTGSIRDKPSFKIILLSVLLLATMFVQAVGEKWGCWAWSNHGRLFIGLVVGGAVSGVMIPLCNYFLSRKTKVRTNHKPLDIALFITLMGLALSVSWIPSLLSILAIVSLGGLLAIYFCMNLAVSGAVLHFKDRTYSYVRTLSLIVLTIFLFVCEGGFFSLIQPKP